MYDVGCVCVRACVYNVGCMCIVQAVCVQCRLCEFSAGSDVSSMHSLKPKVPDLLTVSRLFTCPAVPQGNLTYSRHVLKQDKLPNWAKCDKHFPQLHVSSRGTIEDDGSGMLQVCIAWGIVLLAGGHAAGMYSLGHSSTCRWISLTSTLMKVSVTILPAGRLPTSTLMKISVTVLLAGGLCQHVL